MSGFEDPVGIVRVSDNNVLPFDLEVTRSALEERRTWEGKWIEGGFGWHSFCRWCFAKEVCGEGNENGKESKYW